MLIEKDIIKDFYLNIIKNEWLAASEDFSEFLTAVPDKTKSMNERYAQAVSEDFKKRFRSFPRLPLGRKKWREKTFSMITEVLCSETIIGIHNSMDRQLINTFTEELKEFLRQVRLFAPELSFEDIGQAIRNYIVYAMFKEINEVKSGFSKPAFGYSMLYPFTDNYIDNRNYTAEEKSEYNQIIRDKIEGREACPKNIHQSKTCDLLQAIESEYPRDIDSSVYTLLLMMLEAQEASIKQHDKSHPLSYEERLDISIYKGGISVLIDRFLINKELTDKDIIFYLGLGFFLQLADDLQDIRDDSQSVNQTVFTLDISPAHEEKLVNKLLNFIQHIMEDYHAENDSFKDFILYNCYQLILSSIDRSREFFTKQYISKLENYFPVTYSFFGEFKNSLSENTDINIDEKYMKMLDDMLSG